MSQMKSPLVGYYKFKRTNKKTGLYTLTRSCEIGESALQGKPKGNIKIQKQYVAHLAKGKRKIFKIITKQEGDIGNLFITINCLLSKKMKYGYGKILNPYMTLITIATKSLKHIEFYTCSDLKLDMTLLFDKFENRDFDDEMKEL